jgi:tRNA G18 (ribose-2'-O)-methylase SpoU
MIIRIDDPDDPRLAAYRQVRERDLIGREGRFVAEGQVVVRVLLTQARHRAESLLIAAPRMEGLSGLLAEAPDDLPVYVAGQAVMDAVVGFHIHRGVLAVGLRAPARPAAEVLGELSGDALVVALFGVANHDNLGGVLRNAAAFGADAVILDSDCCDPFYRKAIRVSVGAALIARLGHLAAGEDPLALLEGAGFTPIAFSPGADQPLSRLKRPGRAALLLGAEGPGLPKAILERCARVSIPMHPGWDSLNLATASGVALHHLARAAARGG